MAYDSAADRVILFGGYGAGAIHALNDTWTYDLNANTWTEMTPSVNPPARTGGALVYGVRLDRFVLFGGHADVTGGYLAKNDTWTYDLNSNAWTRAMPATSPSLRALSAMAYDVESDRAVLFGGLTEPYSEPDDATWVYDVVNETWGEMAPAMSPAPRFAASAAYDSAADRVLVFGGGYEAGRNDTWSYDLNAAAWSRINTASNPSDRLSAMAMAYDARSDRTVLFGGSWPWAGVGTPVYNQETWIFDHGNGTWMMVLPDTMNPTLSIASPSDGAVLTSTSTTITGSASDNVGIMKVEVGLNNATWIAATGTTSWSASVTLANGGNTIYVRVTDTAGNTAMSTIHVTVATPVVPPGGQGIPVWAWPLVAVGIVGAAVAAYVMLRRRKKPTTETRSQPR